MRREILMSIIATILLGVCVFIYAGPNFGITLFAIASDNPCSDINCISQNLVTCTPARLDWESDSGLIILEVVGEVDGMFCEIKMTSNGNALRECYFPLESLSESLAEQFFKGKNNGFGQLISDSCK